MKREYGVACTTGRPQVAFCEMVMERAEFAYTHKKQTGGAGQYARVIGHIESMERDGESGTDTAFESVVKGRNVTSN
jgi:elongation factor G